MKRSTAFAALLLAGALGACSSGGSVFAPLAAGAVAPGTPAPTPTPTLAPIVSPSPGPLSLSPSSIAIGAASPTNATFNVTETNYTSAFVESDNCSGVASVARGTFATTNYGNGTSLSAQQYDVTQVGAGSCTAQVADNHGGTGSVAIASTLYGTLAASPANVAIGNGNPTSTTVAINESSYVGSFSQSNNCAGIATVGLSPSVGPSATLTVAQVAAGNCSVQLGDNHGGAVSVAVTSTTSTVIIQSHRRP